MIIANFDIFKVTREAKTQRITTIRTEFDDTNFPDIAEVYRVLRVLYPSASGITLTLM